MKQHTLSWQLNSKRRVNGDLPAEWEEKASAIIADLQANPANIASRKASQNVLEAFGAMLPEFSGRLC